MTSYLFKPKRLAICFFASIATTSLLLGGLKVNAQTTAPEPIIKPSTAPDASTTPSTAPEPITKPSTAPDASTTPSTAPEPITKPSTAPDASTTPSTAPDASTKPTSALKIGSRGNLVHQVQSLLKKKGFYAGPITGLFGRHTHSAVLAFQRAKGLRADGIVGSKTLAAMGL